MPSPKSHNWLYDELKPVEKLPSSLIPSLQSLKVRVRGVVSSGKIKQASPRESIANASPATVSTKCNNTNTPKAKITTPRTTASLFLSTIVPLLRSERPNLSLFCKAKDLPLLFKLENHFFIYIDVG